ATMGNHSLPRAQTFRVGSTTIPRTTAATANRPSVKEPGEKLGPTARMPTNAEAHRTTVTTTAAMPSLLMGAEGAGVLRGCMPGDGWPGSAGVVVVIEPIYGRGGWPGWRFSAASRKETAHVLPRGV